MYIHGTYYNESGDPISVYIVTGGEGTEEVEIGGEAGTLYFTDDPVELTSQVNDTFDIVLATQASVRLLAKDHMAAFYSTTCRDAIVNIYRGDACLFAGYVEPRTYTQDYNEDLDEVELNCIDALSALQYSKYKNVGAAGVVYDLVKAEAAQRSFYDIAVEILQGVTEGIDILGDQDVHYWYDGSKATDAEDANRYSILRQLSISELLFLGDDESDVWQQDEVLEEVLKYLNLHIVQDGFDFYIYSWETIRQTPGTIDWQDIADGTTRQTTQERITISMDNVADCDTTISIDEVYNQLQLTASVEEIDSVVESPLDEDLLVSPYYNKQKYMTELVCDGGGTASRNGFHGLVCDGTTNYDGSSTVDWYVQVMRNKRWTFPMGGDTSTDLVDHFCTDGTYQNALPDWLGKNPGACILSLGSVTKYIVNSDNSPTSNVNMTNYLVLSVNGNEVDNDETNTYPNTDDIQEHIPYAVYTGNSAGGVFSPADENTTNYIVLSGKLVLNPIMTMSGEYSDLRTKEWVRMPIGDLEPWEIHPTAVPSRTNTAGRFYTRQYWEAEKPGDTVSWHDVGGGGFCPYTGKGPEENEFNYSAVGTDNDTINKVAVLACMLIIGDKCVVEKTPDDDLGDTDDDGNPIPYTDEPKEGYKNFVWKKYKERSECQSDDEYYQQCFTIGIDPAVGDKIIGQEFDLQKTFSYELGIDAEGTGIAIRKKDKVSGQVRFMILGPVNSTWGYYTRRHPTFFRHTEWTEHTIPVLAHVSSIFIKSFEVKVYSDNGLVNNGDDDGDIVYLSDTQETFVNTKDDLEFKINSALTSEECVKLGVANSVNMSTPLNVATGDGVTEVYDGNNDTSAKPEQIYVDSYYNEYHAPRIIMEQNLMDKGGTVGLFHHYHSAALNKDFFVQGIGRNLTEGTASMTLKEIPQ